VVQHWATGSSPGRGWEFFSSPHPDRLWAQPASYPLGTRGSFPRGVKLTAHLHLVPRSRMRGAIPPLPQYALLVWCSVKVQGQFYIYLNNQTPFMDCLKEVLWDKLCTSWASFHGENMFTKVITHSSSVAHTVCHLQAVCSVFPLNCGFLYRMYTYVHLTVFTETFSMKISWLRRHIVFHSHK
jgi:hypothetical protein